MRDMLAYHKRMILLYRIGIEIPEHLSYAYKVIFYNLETVDKKVFSGDVCCMVNDAGQLVYGTQSLKNQILLRVNYVYWERITDTLYQYNDNFHEFQTGEILVMVEAVLKYKKVYFDNLTATYLDISKSIIVK